MSTKGQVSIEYLVITAFLLAIVGIFFGFALFMFNESAAIAKADNSVTKIADNANWVASLGDGSKVFFELEVPENTNFFRVQGKSALINLALSAGNNDISPYSKSDLTPASFSTSSGRKTFSAVFLDGNVVVSEIG